MNDGKSDKYTYTVEDIIKSLEADEELGRQYISDVLRVARDILKRAAQKDKMI